MHIVTKSHVQIEGNRIVAEASDLRLPIGGWPEVIAVVDSVQEPELHREEPIYNGWLFIRGRPIGTPGGDDFGGYHYATKDGGVQLDVFND